MATRAVIDRDGARRADLATIHIAKKALGWDDDMYRDILFTVCQVRSSAGLDFSGRKRFLAHLTACGFAGKTRAKPGSTRAKAPWTPSQRLLWSRWQQLADAGLVKTRDRHALDAWVKRQSGVDRLEWLNPQQLDAVLGSCKRWLARRIEPAAEPQPSPVADSVDHAA